MRGPLLPAVLCLLLCAVRCYGQSGPAAAAPGPGLHFAHATCHLGEIPLGRQRDTAFVFGTSAAQALIVSVRTSCSCTGGGVAIRASPCSGASGVRSACGTMRASGVPSAGA